MVICLLLFIIMTFLSTEWGKHEDVLLPCVVPDLAPTLSSANWAAEDRFLEIVDSSMTGFVSAFLKIVPVKINKDKSRRFKLVVLALKVHWVKKTAAVMPLWRGTTGLHLLTADQLPDIIALPFAISIHISLKYKHAQYLSRIYYPSGVDPFNLKPVVISPFAFSSKLMLNPWLM